MSDRFRNDSTEHSNDELKDQDVDMDKNADQKTDPDSEKDIDVPHVTIQLSQNVHTNQQKMEELIAHLSHSGQLKDDRKITIELKDNDSKEDDNLQGKNPSEVFSHQTVSTIKSSQQPIHTIKYVSVQQSPSSPSYNPKTAYLKAGNGSVQVKTDSSGQPGSVQCQGDGKSPATYQIVASGSSQPSNATSNSQQPAYILIPASQQSQQINVTPLSSVASTPIRVVNQGGQHIILQQANTTFATSTPISSFSLKTAGVVKGERNVVVLQQQHQNPVPIVPVRSFSQNHNNRLPPAPPSIAAAATSATFSPNTTSTSVRASRNSGLNSTGKESSWQQYVKQFEKLGPCPICGDKISGYHYGIFCCESCKGFFKRTVQNSKRYACHMATPSSLCEITATSRKKCPACRFVKCLEKGMRMEAIRTDRTRGGRSMYPGSRYLRQLAARASGSSSDVKVDVKSNLSTVTSASLPNIAPHPNNSLSGAGIATTTAPAASVVGGFQSFGKLETGQGVHIMSIGGNMATTYELPASEDVGGGVYLDPAILEDPASGSGQSSSNFQFDCTYRLSSRSQETSDLPELLKEILKVEQEIEGEEEEKLDFENTDENQTGTGSVPPNVTAEEAAVYRALLNLADQRLYRIVRWSRSLPVFGNLETDDQILLLQNCWADLLCLDCCWKSLPTPSEIRLTSTKCINLEAAREMGAEELVDSLLRLTQDLKRLRFSMLDFACFKVCLLMQANLPNLRAVDEVKHLYQCVNQLLMNHLAERNAEVPNKFQELFQRVPDLQRISSIARELLADKDLSPYLSSTSLLMELLRSDFHRQPSASVSMDTSGQVANSFLGGTQGRNEEQVSGESRVFPAGDASAAEGAYSSNGPL